MNLKFMSKIWTTLIIIQSKINTFNYRRDCP